MIQIPRHRRIKRGLAMRMVRDAGRTWEAFARDL